MVGGASKVGSRSHRVLYPVFFSNKSQSDFSRMLISSKLVDIRLSVSSCWFSAWLLELTAYVITYEPLLRVKKPQ